MSIYHIYPKGEDFTITRSESDISIRIKGIEPVPIPEDQVNQILADGKENYKFDPETNTVVKKEI